MKPILGGICFALGLLCAGGLFFSTVRTAWSPIEVRFAARDAGKVPAHWRTFGSRTSTLANGARRAINPANALLNYGYRITAVGA